MMTSALQQRLDAEEGEISISKVAGLGTLGMLAAASGMTTIPRST
jgi:hypothetical protein